jgi:siroheme synthase-like protein
MVEDRNNLFPIFLKLENFHTLLVGGGNVGLEKLSAMLNNSPTATVTVVAPLIREDLRAYASNYPNVTLELKPFEDADIEGKSLIVCATDNQPLHQHIKKIANAKHLLVNVADKPESCDFYLGSIVQKGQLKIAISTNGKSPTIAKRLKEVLNESISDDFTDLLENISQLRNTLKGDFDKKLKILNEHTKALVVKKKEDRSFLRRIFSRNK